MNVKCDHHELCYGITCCNHAKNHKRSDKCSKKICQRYQIKVTCRNVAYLFLIDKFKSIKRRLNGKRT